MNPPEFTLSFFARLHAVTIHHGLGVTDLNVLGVIALTSEGHRAEGREPEASRAEIRAAMPIDERTLDKAMGRLRAKNLVTTRYENRKAWHCLAPGLLKQKPAR